MYGTLLFVSNKKYKKEKVLQIMQQYCFGAEIPEKEYGKITDEHIVKMFNAAKPPEFMVLMAKKKYEETKSEKYRKRLEEYNSLLHGDIEKYFNMQDGFSVKRGKVFTTKNLADGKYKAISFGISDDFQKLLTNKNGNAVDVCKKEELAECSIDSISMFFDYDNDQWHELIKPLVVADGEDFNYQEALERAKEAKKVKLGMIDKINNLDPCRYCYGLIYQL